MIRSSIGRSKTRSLSSTRYVRGLIAQRRRAPGDDLLSALIAVEEAGDRLSTEEMVALTENLHVRRA